MADSDEELAGIAANWMAAHRRGDAPRDITVASEDEAYRVRAELHVLAAEEDEDTDCTDDGPTLDVWGYREDDPEGAMAWRVTIRWED